MTREEALKLNAETVGPRDGMNFTPFDGKCYSCSRDLFERYTPEQIAVMNVTGCPFCHRSYCD